MEISCKWNHTSLVLSISLPYAVPFSQKVWMWFCVINHSNKWGGNFMQKNPDAEVNIVCGRVRWPLFTGELWAGLAGGSCCSLLVFITAGWHWGKANSFPTCLRGEKSNYSASDFPLESWRQSLNSILPQSLQRHVVSKKSLPLLNTHTHTHTWEHRQWLSAFTLPKPTLPPGDQNRDNTDN